VKVLIIQLKQLGDILLSTPLARVVKEELGAEVHFLTSPVGRELVLGNPFIDGVLTLEPSLFSEFKVALQVRRNGYSVVVDSQRSGRSKRITLFSGAPVRIAFKRPKENFYYTHLVEWKNYGYTVWERMELLRPIVKEPVKPYLPQLFLREEELSSARELLKELGLTPGEFFVVVPTSRRRERSWESWKFGKLSRLIYEKTALKPLIAYAPGEREVALKAHVNCPGSLILPSPLPVRKFASLLYFSSFLLGNDSFAGHLSLSLGKRTFVVLGPNEGWFPDGELVVKVKKGLTCQPCGSWKECKSSLACYRELSPEEAFIQLEGELDVN